MKNVSMTVFLFIHRLVDDKRLGSLAEAGTNYFHQMSETMATVKDTMINSTFGRKLLPWMAVM